MSVLIFLCQKGFCKIELQNKIWVNVLRYENKIVYPIYFSSQKFDDSMDLLLSFICMKNFCNFTA